MKKKQDKLRVYPLIISEKFPPHCLNSGNDTFFVDKIMNAYLDSKKLVVDKNNIKLHTIRQNYDYWKPRIDNISNGTGYLSIRVWFGKPYASKSEQKEVFRLDSSNGVGIERLDMTKCCYLINGIDTGIDTDTLANNDGLSTSELLDWFLGEIKPNMPPMAIIHFTNFRYSEQVMQINSV